MATADEIILDLDSDSDIDLLNLKAMDLQVTRRKKKPNSSYLKKRKTHGEFQLSKEIPDKTFKKAYRLTRDQFNEIHNFIASDIKKKGCFAQEPISSEEKLAVCLRFLATGDMFKTIALSYRMGERTVSNIVVDVCDAIIKNLQPMFMPEPTLEMWENIAGDFERKWQFPNCLGSIDGKHVAIRKPIHSGSSFYNYKQHFSVVLLAVADAHYKFTYVDIGAMGRFSDGNVFSNSSLGVRLKDNSMILPNGKSLPGQSTDSPCVFVGDEAFPLMSNLMRPYPKPSLTNNKKNKIFNYRLSRARQTVECAFGILCSRFRIFKRPFECKLETIDKVVLAVCILHNYLRNKSLSCNNLNEEEDDDDEDDNDINNALLDLPKSRVRSSKQAFEVREKFKDFFNSPEGTVDWQETAIARGHF